MLALKGTVLEICFQQRQITWGQCCASLQSHGQAIQCEAIQILALLAFVCFPFSIVAVLGNCKQHQHSPEIRLPQSHALLKALQLSQKSATFFAFFPLLLQINYVLKNVFGTYWNESVNTIIIFVKENNPTLCAWLNCSHPNTVCREDKCVIMVNVHDRFFGPGIRGCVSCFVCVCVC